MGEVSLTTLSLAMVETVRGAVAAVESGLPDHVASTLAAIHTVEDRFSPLIDPEALRTGDAGVILRKQFGGTSSPSLPAFAPSPPGATPTVPGTVQPAPVLHRMVPGTRIGPGPVGLLVGAGVLIAGYLLGREPAGQDLTDALIAPIAEEERRLRAERYRRNGQLPPLEDEAVAPASDPTGAEPSNGGEAVESPNLVNAAEDGGPSGDSEIQAALEALVADAPHDADAPLNGKAVATLFRTLVDRLRANGHNELIRITQLGLWGRSAQLFAMLLDDDRITVTAQEDGQAAPPIFTV